MTQKFEITNKFELVTLAGARARQLLRGCTPRVEGPAKTARVATLEVKQGQVRKVEGEE